MNGNQLYHYGVLGMRWGVRRTPEQLGSSTPMKTKKEKKAAYAEERRKIESLSTEDLKKRIERLDMEKRYRQHLNELDPKKASAIKKILADVATKGLTSLGDKMLSATLDKIFKKENKKQDRPIDLHKIDPSKLGPKAFKQVSELIDSMNKYEQWKKQNPGQTNSKLSAAKKRYTSAVKNGEDIATSILLRRGKDPYSELWLL